MSTVQQLTQILGLGVYPFGGNKNGKTQKQNYSIQDLKTKEKIALQFMGNADDACKIVLTLLNANPVNIKPNINRTASLNGHLS